MKESQVNIYFTDGAEIIDYVTAIIHNETRHIITFERSDNTVIVVNTAFLKYYDVVRIIG